VTLSRFRLPLVLVTSMLAVSCAQPPDRVAPKANPLTITAATGGCGPGVQRREAPVVCVDDSGETLRAIPDTIYAFDTHPEDRSPVNIVWFTSSGGGNLRIEPESSTNCVSKVWCNPKSGHCRARTLPLNGKQESRCKYDVVMVEADGRERRLDPIVIVQPCCP
jgi:hypothetical protein